MKLNDLLEAFTEAHGVGRLVVMSQLRSFVARSNVKDLLDEIGTIQRDDYLDVLLGVGMRGVLYYAVVARKAKLMGI